jgi:hypothetical protein
MAVDSGMRVWNPQKRSDFLLVGVFLPLGCNVAKYIRGFAHQVLWPVPDFSNKRSIINRIQGRPQETILGDDCYPLSAILLPHLARLLLEQIPATNVESLSELRVGTYVIDQFRSIVQIQRI